MKSSFHKYVFLVILFLTTLTDLSAQDGWLKRKWHDMNARFNGYYNSKVLVHGAVQTLEDKQVDNFNNILRVFPYGTEESAAAVKADMDKVYKKCSKVIRKHPNSKWEDECYLLIGQSHFFKYDPFAAIETFQYINKKFKDEPTRYDAQIWILKSYLRQEKYNDAEAIMGLFIQDKDFPKRLDKELNAIAADIYIQQGKYKPAIEKLELALSLTKDRGEKFRWHFILGQLYLETGDWIKARDHFVRTIKLNPPYDLAFQSNLGLVKTISMGEGSLKTPKKYLNRMLKDDKNIDYYDQIYFELAKIAIKEGNTNQAIKYFQESAHASTKNTDQKASAYLELANIYFQERNYEASQAYFDSTVSFISDSHPDYEKIKARHSILTDLIDNLVEVKTQDSLLALSRMDRKDLDKFIDDLIRKKKDDAERQALEKELNSFAGGNNQPTGIPQNPNSTGEFYFANKAAMSRGMAEFTRKWGSRKRTDFWRINAKARKSGSDEEDATDEEYQEVTYDESDDKEQQKLIAEVPEDKREYYKNIPLSDIGKKIANQKIEQALFNIAMLYEEKLKEYNKAIGYYENLFNRYPDTKLGAEATFHLYKCYKAIDDEATAEKYARILDEKYKDSDFNQVVNNRDVEREPGEEEEVLDLYHKMYDAYKSGNYDKAISYRNEANQKYYGNSIQAKYDYLYAMIVAESGDTEKYLSLLQAIAENYPGTEIANNATFALEHYARLQNKEEAEQEEEVYTGDYEYQPQAEHYYMVVLDAKNSSQIMAAFADYNKKQHSLDGLKVQNYPLGDKLVIAVQSFKDKEAAEKYYIEFIKNGKFFKDLGVESYDNYYISKRNFKVMIKEQTADTYAVFFLKNYIQ